MSAFTGVYTALVTPFDSHNDVDFAALDALVDKQIAAGVDGLVPCGTTGESPTLSHPEHDAVIKRVIERAAGRVKVMAGTGSNSTREAVRLTTQAEQFGADAALVVTPYYNRPSQQGVFEYYKAISEASELPVMVYNIASRTGCNVETDTLLRIADLPNVIGVKEASGSLDQMASVMARLVHDCHPKFSVLSGDDSLTLPLMGIGGHGVVSVASNLVPEEVVAMVRAAEQGEFNRAREIYFRLWPLFKVLFVEPNPVPVKWAMGACGQPVGGVRSPLCAMQASSELQLVQVLKRLGLMEG
jgi:4-hydroxy-tetrahydrodipicolinate synthase